MPCYQIVTAKVEFKISNIDLLKKALGKEGWIIYMATQEEITLSEKVSWRKDIIINVKSQTASSQFFTQREIIDKVNLIKKAYSLQVIDEVAKKQKWIKKNLGQNRFALQRF